MRADSEVAEVPMAASMSPTARFAGYCGDEKKRDRQKCNGRRLSHGSLHISDVRGPEMAPDTPNARSALAEPWRSSIFRQAL